MNPFLVEQSTISANTWFSELPSAASAQGKWVLSEEVRDEISAVHGYSMALARADLSHGSNIFLLTSLGYSQSVTCATERHAIWSSYVEFMNGLGSSLSIMPIGWEPAVMHAEIMLSQQLPVAYMIKEQLSTTHTLNSLGVRDGSTLHLTARLAGGAPAAQSKRVIWCKRIRGKKRMEPIPGMCPFVDSKNGACHRRAQRKLQFWHKGIYYCQKHAWSLKKRPHGLKRARGQHAEPTSRGDMCPYVDTHGVACHRRVQRKLQFRHKGIYYCQKHAWSLKKRPHGLKRASGQHAELPMTRGSGKRLCKKTSPADFAGLYEQQRAMCQYVGGCRTRANQSVDGVQLCKRHARVQQGECVRRVHNKCAWQDCPLPARYRFDSEHLYCATHFGYVRRGKMTAVMPIEAYSDELVEPYRLGPLTTKCKFCGSLNFREELVGQPPHFQICCYNGKVSRIKKFVDVESVSSEFLSS